MTIHRRVGSRAPLSGLAVAVLTLLLLPGLALSAEWTKLERVSSTGDSRLDSLHQAAAAADIFHLVHARLGPRKADDKVVYQSSANDGKRWSGERVLFKANASYRKVVPNLAIDARGRLVVVAFRVSGPGGHTLFVKVSRDGGRTWGPKVSLFSTKKATGIGVPAVAVGRDVVAAAWTNRANGEVRIRTSRDAGKSFKRARSLGRTRLSIDCSAEVTDGLVGIAASDRTVHVAWSHAGTRQCYADRIKVRTSRDRGASWGPARTVTTRDSFGWPELDARGSSVIATVQSVDGALIVARSHRYGRGWQERVFTPPDGYIFSAGDVTILPRKRVVIAYVKERLKDYRLVATRLVTRRSPDGGGSWQRIKPVTKEMRRLRVAPNIVANDSRLTLVVQAGDLDGKPRNVFASRLR